MSQGCGCGGACGCGGGASLGDTAQVLEFKDFSDPERAKLAKKGEAMPGGGFPIRNATDLHNAVSDVPRSKNPAAAKAWVVKRAKDLNLVDQLPSTWELSVRVSELEDAVVSFASIQFATKAKDAAGEDDDKRHDDD